MIKLFVQKINCTCRKKSISKKGNTVFTLTRQAPTRGRAFTLAEVLITLGIIGVVAAMTIPNLMTKINERVHRAQLKKTISTLNQAVKMVYNNTDTIYGCYYGSNGSGKGASGDECSSLKIEMEKVLKISHICNNNAYKNGCIPKYKGKDTVLKENYGEDYDLSSAAANCGGLFESAILKETPVWVLQDGTIIGLYIGVPKYIFVDVNGAKGPNKWGYDIFILQLRMSESNLDVSYLPEKVGCGIIEKGGKSAFKMMN